jgi:hypothetical protein
VKKSAQLALMQTEPEQQAEPLRSWALVELFGHARIVGLVTVDPPEFPGLVRVDVPDLLKDGTVIRKGFTRYVGKAALYGVTPIDEEAVRALLPEIDGRPHRPMSFDRGDY